MLPRVFTTSGALAALADLGLYQVKSAAEFAPGIPSGKPISRLPSIKPTTLNRWTLAVQDHEAARAGRHYDLRLVDPDAGKAHSWAIPKARLPEPGEKLLAVQTFTHTPEYALHFGDKKPEVIPEGYGKGRVRIAVKAPVDIIEANNDKVRFNLYEGKQNNEYVLRRTRENKWLLQNVTITKATTNVPQSKPTYKETEPDKVDVTNDDQLMMAKVDGAHNTIQLNAGQPVRIFSYRPTERDTGIIEHTHRFLPGLTSRVPDHLDGLVLRGELFAADPHTGRAREAVETGAVLNSGVWKSRDTQTHSPLRAVVFDVARRNGKDVESVPYQEKLDILKRVNEALPFLELPPMAGTAKEKIQLLERIRSGREPITSEGVVMWPLGGGPPVKAKFRPDHDVYVREVFPEGGKREGLAGGFTYSWTPRGKIVGRVGTGITHDLKQDMLAHPEKYIGRVARVRALGLYTDKDNPKKPGALRAPSFSAWHLDKGMQQLEEKTAELEKRGLGERQLRRLINALQRSNHRSNLARDLLQEPAMRQYPFGPAHALFQPGDHPALREALQRRFQLRIPDHVPSGTPGLREHQRGIAEQFKADLHAANLLPKIQGENLRVDAQRAALMSIADSRATHQSDLRRIVSGRHSPQDVVKLKLPSEFEAAENLNIARSEPYVAWRGGDPSAVYPANTPLWYSGIPNVSAGYTVGNPKARLRAFDLRTVPTELQGPWTPHIAVDPWTAPDVFQQRLALGKQVAGRSPLGNQPNYEKVIQSQATPSLLAEYKAVDPSEGLFMRTRGERLLKAGSLLKAAALYHGSPRQLDELVPSSEHGDPDLAERVFATPSRTFATAYAGKKWGDRDIAQSTRGGGKTPFRMLLREMRPGALKDIYDTSGYLYTVPEESFSRESRRTRMEVTSPTAVKPLKTQQLANVLRTLKRHKDVELLPYDPAHPTTETAVRRSIKRMREMPLEGQQEYRNWRLENAPPEMKALWERLEKQSADIAAYVTGPSGAGKTTFVHKNYPADQFHHLHSDAYRRLVDGKRDYDWERAVADAEASGKPVVVDSMNIHEPLARAAQKKILLDVPEAEAIRRRALRAMNEHDLNPEEGKGAYNIFQKEMRPRAEALGFKVATLDPAAHAYRERRGNCGPASLRIALHHHGLDAPEAVLAKATQTTRRGTDPEAIARVVGAKVREGMTLKKLRELTRAGTPVITAYQDGPARSDRNGHYSVVSKVDRYVHLSDPSSRKPIRKMTGAEFRARWHDVDQHGRARVHLGIPIKKVE